MRKIVLFSILPLIMSLSACSNQSGSQGHTHDVTGGHKTDGEHNHETESRSYTLFAGNYELFVEFPPLVVDRTSAFAAHFTDLTDYSPVSQGQVTVSLISGNRGIRHTVDAPASPGIFRPALRPGEPGNYRLLFEMSNSTATVEFQIDNIRVFVDTETAEQQMESSGNGDEIIFLKEQAWKTDFATSVVQKTDFHTVINTSALIKSVPQSEVILSAQSSGTVNLLKVPGEKVKKGDLLAVITAAGFEDNLNVRLNQYRIAYEKSRADYQRTKPLAESRTISQKDFLEIRSRYLQDSVRYYQMERNVSGNGLSISAPFEGFVSDIPVNNGEYVETGATILKVKNGNQVLVEAYVNQSDYQLVNSIFNANVRIPADGRVIALSSLDGRIRAAQAFAGENNTRIPVTFSVTNNGLLMQGMFLEAFLLAGKKENALVIPLSAVTEEQGQYYVYVQTGGESFVKRQIEMSNNDGFNVEVASGLEEGERIVTKGSYQIKLAAMSGELPLHGHTH